MTAVFQLGKYRRVRMARIYVIYYPPTTGHPYLVVTFLADRSLQATPFDSEEEAEAFIERASHPHGCPTEPLAADTQATEWLLRRIKWP